MSENIEELKKQFINLVQEKNSYLGSIMRVSCDVEPDIKKGILIVSPDAIYKRDVIDGSAIIDEVSRRVFGRKMIMTISSRGERGKSRVNEEKQEVPPPRPVQGKSAMADSGSQKEDHEAIQYLLDSMHFENTEERQRIEEQLREHIKLSMTVENTAKRKKGKREARTVRELKIYKIPAILRDSHDMLSLKKALKKHLGKDGSFHVSGLARLCADLPWNWSFNVGEYTVHGKKRFLGISRTRCIQPDANGAETRPAKSKVVPARFAGSQVPESDATPATDHAPNNEARSPREIALEEEIGKLRDRIDYFERLFEDHIHDVRTGQPYRPVKLGLASSDKTA